MQRPTASNIRSQRLNPLWEGHGLLLAVGLCLTIIAALFSIYQPLALQQTELRLYDNMLSGRTIPPKSGVPVLVGIDEESLKGSGQWPWPRYRLARLVKQLQNMGASVIVLDFLMPEADRTSPEIIVSERQFDREMADSLPQTKPIDSNSQRLANTLGQGATVLGYFFEFSGPNRLDSTAMPNIPAGTVISMAAGSDAGWPKPNAMIRSLPILTDKAAAEGFTNARHDLDGTLRSVPLLISHNGKQYPSLALSAMLLATKNRNIRIRHENETILEWNQRLIPLTREGNILLDFRSEQPSFPYYSAKQILNSSHTSINLQGKIVLVGAWAKGLGDTHLVPSGKSIPGLKIHATIIDNILAETFISRPDWARGAELFIILLLGTASTIFLSRSGFVSSLLFVAAGSAGCYGAAKALLVSQGIYLAPLIPILTPLVILTFLSLLKYGIEAKKVRQRTRDLVEAQDTIIISMSTLAEAHDRETGKHILRTRHYVNILARQLASQPKYSDLDPNSVELLSKSAPLHDIGKVGIPDSILHKPGSLTDDEYLVMKSHTLIGSKALSRTIGETAHPEQLDFLHYAQQMTESHHECWDGSGYPHGLSGEDIPLAGRLMALADVYDAMVSQRVYKEGIPHDKVCELIAQQAGIKFDPDIVAAFLAQKEEFYRVAQEIGEETDEDTPAGEHERI